MNTILALVIIVVTFSVMYGKPSKNMILGALGIVSAITLFASVSAAQIGDFGPLLGVSAFVCTFGLIYFFNRR